MSADTSEASLHIQTDSMTTRSLPMRLWLAAPDWLFRVLGFGFFAGFLAIVGQKYWDAKLFWEMVPWSNVPGYGVVRMPWVPVLIDATYLLMAVSYILRINPRYRADNGFVISVTMLTAFAPFLVISWIPWLVGLFNEDLETAYFAFLWKNPITWKSALTGGLLISLGIAIDVWGYFVLCRSFGIVPEARELKTTGPYRWVRHPVYLGQFLSQAGVLLFFARIHVVWIGMYCLFVGLQLYRSKLEDRVLSRAFGAEYEAWRRRTFWFV
jgi:protein-S-isoprenylcysteine O-methyltransferase Ste14